MTDSFSLDLTTDAFCILHLGNDRQKSFINNFAFFGEPKIGHRSQIILEMIHILATTVRMQQ